MSQASDTIVIGKIGAPYGVKGWVKITTYTDEIKGYLTIRHGFWVMARKNTPLTTGKRTIKAWLRN